ncbi:MAG: amidohydrolase family protein [Burkholderiales bacterium]|nr:amidohydrolase family protein [Burkholderiales bacterium]
MLDLAIRGATVYDGSGGRALRADVGVRGGRIVAVGALGAPVRATVDAGGLALAPGIVDVHTHYDAQITWDATLSPSPSLGVTTAVIGNCGFGIAPCLPAHRERLLRDLSVVGGVDLEALLAGAQWDFESFGEYMSSLGRRRPFANVAVLAQHSTIRTAVMGEAACERVVPTPDELRRMRDIVRGALRAGAIGLASSFSPNQRGWGARPMPSTLATDAELAALVGVLGEEARGVIVSASGPRATPEYMEDLAAVSGRPAFIATVLAMHDDAAPERALGMYESCRAALARGHEVYIHASCQPLSFDFTLRDPTSSTATTRSRACSRRRARRYRPCTATRRSARPSARISRGRKPGSSSPATGARSRSAARRAPARARSRAAPSRSLRASRAVTRWTCCSTPRSSTGSTRCSSAGSSTATTTASRRCCSIRPEWWRSRTPARTLSSSATRASACTSSATGCASGARSASPRACGA